MALHIPSPIELFCVQRGVCSVDISQTESAPLVSGMLDIKIVGVTVDVESTLVVYRFPGGDGNRYTAALCEHFPESALSLSPSQQLLLRSLVAAVPTSWKSYDRTVPEVKAAYKVAWTEAVREWKERLASDETLSEHERRENPWGSPRESDRLGFFQSVIERFFGWSVADKDKVDYAALMSAFTHFLVQVFYQSTDVYGAASGNEEFAKWYTQLQSPIPMGIVSNTDQGCLTVLKLFPAYQNLFFDEPRNSASMKVTASDAVAQKPSGDGIRKVMTHVLGRTDLRSGAELWLHIGDDQDTDGGAAADAGALYWKCDPQAGVDFVQLRQLLELQGEALLEALTTLGIIVHG